MPTIYPPLNIGAKKRLEIFRREACQKNWVRQMNWKDVRFATLKSHTGLSQGFNDKTPIWHCHNATQLKEINAHELLNSRIRGFYTNLDCDETAKAYIFKLNRGRYLAGYIWTANDERVIFPAIFDDETEAARAAVSHAESFADDAREDSERYERARQIEDEIEEKLNRRLECLKLARINWKRDLMREESEELREEIKALRDELKKYSDYI